MRIADVLRGKGGAVVTINPDAMVSELLAGLAEHNIGAMVVVGPDGVKGIVSERDVVRQLHAHGAAVLSLPVEKIMTAVVSTCSKSDTVDSLTLLMTEHRVRHVPVLEDGKLIGIVSIGDVVKTRMQELESEHEQLQSYITEGCLSPGSGRGVAGRPRPRRRCVPESRPRGECFLPARRAPGPAAPNWVCRRNPSYRARFRPSP